MVNFEPGREGNPVYPTDFATGGHTKVVTSDPHQGKQCLWVDVAKGGGGVSFPLSLRPGTLYRIAFFYRLSYPWGADTFQIRQTGEAGAPVRIWVDWKQDLVRRHCPFFGYAHHWALAESYVYALQEGQVKVSISFGAQLDGVTEGWLDDIIVEEIKADYRVPQQLILDGGIENGGYPFLAGYGSRQALTAGTAWLAVDRTEFMEGRSSLKMVNVGFSSNELLLRAGGTYQVSFWTKCSQPDALVRTTLGPSYATIPLQPPGHYYHGLTRVGSTEWKRFVFSLTIPSQGDKYYYGEWAPWVLSISATCPAWVDEISVTRVAP